MTHAPSVSTVTLRFGTTSSRPYPCVVLFLFFGLSSKQKFLGAGEVRTCLRCHNTTQWTRMRQFRQFTLFFIPIARWSRRQFQVCGICGATVAE
jgi:hypothetical protein